MLAALHVLAAPGEQSRPLSSDCNYQRLNPSWRDQFHRGRLFGLCEAVLKSFGTGLSRLITLMA